MPSLFAYELTPFLDGMAQVTIFLLGQLKLEVDPICYTAILICVQLEIKDLLKISKEMDKDVIIL